MEVVGLSMKTEERDKLRLATRHAASLVSGLTDEMHRLTVTAGELYQVLKDLEDFLEFGDDSALTQATKKLWRIDGELNP